MTKNTPDHQVDLCIDGSSQKLYTSIVNDGPVAICFDPWTPRPDITTPPFAFSFWKARGVNVVAIKSGVNDWYQSAEMPPILATADAICGQRERIGYGSSMGAYAILNFSDQLRIGRALLFAPQFSIDRALVPFENRWHQEFKSTTFVCDQVASSRPIGQGMIMFDPRHMADSKHVALIYNRHPIPLVPVPFSGHTTIEYFSRAGKLSRLVEDVALHGISVKRVIEQRRTVRWNSSRYWMQRAAANIRRRQFSNAIDDALRAEALPASNVELCRHLRAAALWGIGQRAEALAIWQTQLIDPAQAVLTHWRIRQLATDMEWPGLTAEECRALFALTLPPKYASVIY